MTSKRMGFVAIALITAICFVSGGIGVQPAAPLLGGTRCGLRIAPPVVQTAPRDLPGDPYGVAAVIAERYPNDFSYPTVTGDAIVLPAVSNMAIGLTMDDAALAQFIARVQPYYSFPDDPYASGAMDISAGFAGITLVAAPTGRSYTQLRALVDEVFDMRGEAAFADAHLVAIGIGAGQVVITVHTLTCDLATAIVDRFGADDIVVEEQPNFNPQLLPGPA
jgi:hypothetical protein